MAYAAGNMTAHIAKTNGRQKTAAPNLANAPAIAGQTPVFTLFTLFTLNFL
jgi:hypothetical protein